jgi:hypothetical protein
VASDSLTRYELESESGLFAFADPCELDDGMGLIEPEELLPFAATVLNHVRFAAAAGRYQIEVLERDLPGWGRRVCRLELKPARAPERERDWQTVGWVSVDTGTVVVFDPERLAESTGELYYEDLCLLASSDRHATSPAERPCLLSSHSGFGDGGYEVEVDGPPEAAEAARVTFIADED